MKQVNISTHKREELVDITSEVKSIVKESGIKDGLVVVYTKHTTSGITINENADPDVKHDIIMGLKDIVKDLPYHHGEGNSDAHIKSSLIGSSVTVLIEDGSMVLGTWQGLMFCEFDGPRNRTVLVKVVSN